MKTKENVEAIEIVEEVKVVEKEVIVEVPVEKIVEVEVEKIVEVPVEVIKEVTPKLDFLKNFEVAKALALFNADMIEIEKNAKNPFFKSSYLDLSAIANTTRPILAKHGLSIIQHPVDDENGRICVDTILLHSSGQHLTFPSVWCKPTKLGDVQQLASTITYLKRISIAALLFVAGKDEDDDGEKAVGRTETTTPPTTRGTSLRGRGL